MTERISRHQLREILLGAGVDLLLEEGMRAGLDHVTFPRVFERIEKETGRRITRASVYDRIWQSQAEFQWDVLARVVEASSAIDERTRQRIDAVLATADRSCPEGRLACLHELCQLVVEQHVMESSRRQNDRVITAAVGAIASTEHLVEQPPGVARVRAALGTFLERQTELYYDLYLTIGARLGFRLRDPLDLRHFVLVLNALGDGLAMRLNFFPEYGEAVSVPPFDGEGPPTRGCLAGVAVEAIARSMLELDPDWPGPG